MGYNITMTERRKVVGTSYNKRLTCAYLMTTSSTTLTIPLGYVETLDDYLMQYLTYGTKTQIEPAAYNVQNGQSSTSTNYSKVDIMFVGYGASKNKLVTVNVPNLTCPSTSAITVAGWNALTNKPVAAIVTAFNAAAGTSETAATLIPVAITAVFHA